MSAHPPRAPRDGGFTLIEVATAVVLLSIMLGIGVSGWRQWANASAQAGAAQSIQSALRSAQQRAVTEAVSTCVLFDVARDQFRSYVGACSSTSKTPIGSARDLGSSQVHLSSAAFTGSTGTSPGVTFFSRGTATPGTVRLRRDDDATTTTLRVEGLTGRVAIS